MEEGIQRDASGALLGQRFTLVRVDIDASEVAVGDIPGKSDTTRA